MYFYLLLAHACDFTLAQADLCYGPNCPTCHFLIETLLCSFITVDIPVATINDSIIYHPPVDFAMDDFIEHKNKDDAWYSPPFYTHNGGYLMCLAVVANGYGSGSNTHVGVAAHLMAGENDNNLKWPFRGAVTVSILNQRGNHHHVTGTITFSDGTPDVYCARVVSGRRAERGLGNAKFIAHSDLAYNKHNNTEYLSNNSLRLHIEQATIFTSRVASKLPSWYPSSTPSVAEFTISEFSKHKVPGDEWCSPPFCTHPQGYKFSVTVMANGRSRGEGTHVSVGVTMMKGEYDDLLTFPFRGVFTVEIINWLQDEHHIRHTISITDDFDSDHRAGGRVTTDYALLSSYLVNMLPHSSLPYNPTTNTQYLDDDCMRIRVVKVDIHSK